MAGRRKGKLRMAVHPKGTRYTKTCEMRVGENDGLKVAAQLTFTRVKRGR